MVRTCFFRRLLIQRGLPQVLASLGGARHCRTSNELPSSRPRCKDSRYVSSGLAIEQRPEAGSTHLDLGQQFRLSALCVVRVVLLGQV